MFGNGFQTFIRSLLHAACPYAQVLSFALLLASVEPSGSHLAASWEPLSEQSKLVKKSLRD